MTGDEQQERWSAPQAWAGSGRLLRRGRGLRLNLALQGGGAHGAFTWGVLDRLLEQPRLEIAAISGASAGALNAVALASGWLSGGAAGARRTLAELWREVARLAGPGALRAAGLTQMAADLTAQLVSPYQLGWDVNPLRAVLQRLIDFERLRAARSVRLFVGATNVRSGTARIFGNEELTVEAVLASACLPQMHRAIEIDGEVYWDGGFTANPPLVPLVERSGARDLVLVQINPLRNDDAPRSARAIRNRMAEIVFGRPLADELDRLRQRPGFSFGWLDRRRRRLARHRLHVIDGSPLLASLDPSTKVDPKRPLLEALREHGRSAAEAWLEHRGIARPTVVQEAPAAQRRPPSRRAG